MPSLKKHAVPMSEEPASFKHVRDIEVHEGRALVCEFKVDGRDPYLFIWRDSDDEFNRWLALAVSKREIAMYESRQVTLFALVQRSVASFLVDIDEDGDFQHWFLLLRQTFPKEYLPGQVSYFDPTLRPQTSSNGHARGQQILVDGQWTLDELARYPRRFEDAYAAHYMLSNDAAAQVRRDTPFKYRFKSGWVYRKFWNSLGKGVRKIDRPHMNVVQYSSPGVIQYSLNEEVAGSVIRTVRNLERNLETTSATYREIHLWLKTQKSDKAREKARAKNQRIPSRAAVERELRLLCTQLGRLDYDLIQGLSNELVNTAEVVLSYYRSLRALAGYEMTGRATLVSVDPLTPPPARDDEIVLGADDDDDDSA